MATVTGSFSFIKVLKSFLSTDCRRSTSPYVYARVFNTGLRFGALSVRRLCLNLLPEKNKEKDE